MNKRIWSIAIALAMLLSMVCSVFVVSADETQAALQIEQVEEQIEEQIEEQLIEEIEISQQAPLLAADADTLTSLKLTPSTEAVAVGNEFTVNLSLANYSSDWATFTAELTYDASAVEYLGYDEDAVSEDLFVSVEEDTDKLTITVLSNNGENISITDLLTLKFKATAVPAFAISTTLVAGTVARYNTETGAAEEITESEYVKVTTISNLAIEKKVPYLTVQLVDENGDAITSIKQNEEVRAIVTLNDYYDPWMAMTLSLNYDATKFTFKDAKDLDAFVSDANGEMSLIPSETEDAAKPLSICFMSTDLTNRSLKPDEDGNAVTTAEILELTLVAKATATGTVEIGTSFVEGGNLKTDPETEETITLTPDSNDFIVEAEENSSASVTIQTVKRPYLTLEVEGGVTKVIQGESFTVNVKINDFDQEWSAMSLIAQFDNTVFKVDESAVEAANEDLLFGDYIVPYVSGGTLGVSLLSGYDVGIAGEEGIILKIPMTAIEGATLTGTFPIKVFFAPEGNIADGETVDEATYDSKKDAPATVEMKVAVQGKPQVKIEIFKVTDADGNEVDLDTLDRLKAGYQVQFKVSVENFVDAWSTMTLQVGYDSSIFDLVPVSDELHATDLLPFVYPDEDTDVSSFFTSANGGKLAACWFNGVDLPMQNTTLQEVMTFTLKVKEEYTLTEEEQIISAGFYPEGNISNDKELVGSDPSDPNGEGDFISGTVDVTVKVDPMEALTVYVEISWGAMEFTYNFGKWNTETLMWEGAGWVYATDANKITVTNKGEADVTAAFEFTPSATGVSGAFYDANDALISAPIDVDAPTEAEFRSKDAYLKLVQTSEPDTAQTTLGTIKVTIDKAESE